VKIKCYYIILFTLFLTQNVLSQEQENEKVDEELKVATEEVAVKKKKREKKIRPYEPLAPARAAFYSAVLPGLGQAYQRKYWKVPIVYAAIGTGVFFYVQNNNNYNRVTAHLQQYNVTEDLSFKPKVKLNEFNTGLNYGISLNYSF